MREQYPAIAYYLLAPWLVGFLFFLFFYFSIFSANSWYRAHRTYMTELPRCALYLSERKQYPPRAYYLLSIWLFGFFDFLFSIFLLTLGTERIARYMVEFPRCAQYISGWGRYLPRAYYSPAFWLFGFWFFYFHFSANAWYRAHRTLHGGIPPLRAIY